MIEISFENLIYNSQKNIYQYYLIFGNDLFLIEDSKRKIKNFLNIKKKNIEHFNYVLDEHINWDNLFDICKKNSLFFKIKIITITFSNCNFSVYLNNKLEKLISLLNKDLIFIMKGNILISSIKYYSWFNILKYKKSLLINCFTPKKEKLYYLVHRRAKKMNLLLDNKTCKLICCYYEGNLLALFQSLIKLSLIYNNKTLTFSRVKSVITNSPYFSPDHWFDSILEVDLKRALNILYYLKLNFTMPKFILSVAQNNILILIVMKKYVLSDANVNSIFEKYNIIGNRRLLFLSMIKRISFKALNTALFLIVNIDLCIKEVIKDNVWSCFFELTKLLCSNNFREY